MASIFKDEEDYIIKYTKRVTDLLSSENHYEERVYLQNYLLSFNFSKDKVHLSVELPIIRDKKDQENGLITVQEVNLSKKVDKDVNNLVRFMIEEKNKLLQDKSYLTELIGDVFITTWFLTQECPICIEFNAHTRCDRCQFPICSLCLNKLMKNHKKIVNNFCQCNRKFYVFEKVPPHRLAVNEENDLDNDLNETIREDLFYNFVNNDTTENNDEDTEDYDTEDDDDDSENYLDAEDYLDDSEYDNDYSEDYVDDSEEDVEDTEDDDSEEEEIRRMVLKSVSNCSLDFTVNCNLQLHSDDTINNVKNLEDNNMNVIIADADQDNDEMDIIDRTRT